MANISITFFEKESSTYIKCIDFIYLFFLLFLPLSKAYILLKLHHVFVPCAPIV